MEKSGIQEPSRRPRSNILRLINDLKHLYHNYFILHLINNCIIIYQFNIKLLNKIKT
jgi:hypothetical protein